MKHSARALLVGLVLVACTSKHDASQHDAGPRGSGGSAGSGGRPAADGGRSGSSGHQAHGGMSGSCERPDPWSGGRSGSGGVPVLNRGTTGGVGGIKYPCPGDSMLRATPGTTDCGPSDCTSYPRQPTNQLGQPYCCAQGGYFCAAGNLAACESGPVYYCDEAADCDEGLHCCTVAGRTMFTCQADCDGRLQLCKNDEECENGEQCEPHDCGKQLRGLCGGLPDRSTLCSPLE